MFGYLNMLGTYDQRKIDNTTVNNTIIDTCRVTDSDHPYETAISHPKYKEGNWVIVEEYDTTEQAQEGHDKWVKEFEKGMPEQLKDISTCVIHKMILALYGE